LADEISAHCIGSLVCGLECSALRRNSAGAAHIRPAFNACEPIKVEVVVAWTVITGDHLVVLINRNIDYQRETQPVFEA
jgi:hypothetical protein